MGSQAASNSPLRVARTTAAAKYQLTAWPRT